MEDYLTNKMINKQSLIFWLLFIGDTLLFIWLIGFIGIRTFSKVALVSFVSMLLFGWIFFILFPHLLNFERKPIMNNWRYPLALFIITANILIVKWVHYSISGVLLGLNLIWIMLLFFPDLLSGLEILRGFIQESMEKKFNEKKKKKRKSKKNKQRK